jgi:hypothetical protein
MTTISRLTKNAITTTIHGVTGQEIEEGTLEAGALARRIVTRQGTECEITRFETSTDGGKSWYLQETYEAPAGLFEQIGPLETLHRGGETVLAGSAAIEP